MNDRRVFDDDPGDGDADADEWDELDADEWDELDDDERVGQRYLLRPRRRWPRVVALVLAVVLVAGVVVGVWVQRQLDPPGSAGEVVVVEIVEGSSTSQIAEQLADLGVVSNALVFRAYLRVNDVGPVGAGTYELALDDSMAHVTQVLEAGPQRAYSMVTIPEGLTLAEIAARVGESSAVSAEALSAAATSGQVVTRYGPAGATNLEGLLAPETYRVEATATAADVVAQLAGQQDLVAQEVGYDDAEALTGYSAYEVLTIASLIEAEAKVDGDRAKIARVIYNRLDRGMTLGIDATVYYALGRRGGELTATDLEVDSPYNTRRFGGLPPTPIGAPGRASLEAALRPADGEWIYYVLADEDGTHAFSETAEQFNQDVAEARAKGLL